jgi:hypothetical protein
MNNEKKQQVTTPYGVDYYDPKKIETCGDLPEYGKYVLVNGINKQMYGIRRWHVCEMDDLEDGLDFRETGQFFWLTENGTKIDDVTHWCELPLFP